MGERAEIDVCGDVLKTREAQRIGVGIVAVVAHQSAASALRMIIFARGKAVVDQQRGAVNQGSRKRARQSVCREMDLSDIARRKL